MLAGSHSLVSLANTSRAMAAGLLREAAAAAAAGS